MPDRIAIDLVPHAERWVTLETDTPESGAWALVRERFAHDSANRDTRSLQVRVDRLVAKMRVLQEVHQLYGCSVELSSDVQLCLSPLRADRQRRVALMRGEFVLEDQEDLAAELQSAGFTRVLREFQLKNLAYLLALPHGADFSVPGSGKTTVLHALHTLLRARGVVDVLCVVAPLSASTAWKDEATQCFDVPLQVGVLTSDDIPACEVLLLNYHRMASRWDAVESWVARNETHLVLDEAHRAKRGRQGEHGAAALDLAMSAIRRDVLTGTPAPQGASDFIAPLEFLYPGQADQLLPADAFQPGLPAPETVQRVQAAIKPLFVRTTKSELQLPPTRHRRVVEPMGELQAAIYRALVGEYLGPLIRSASERYELQELGAYVMYLLEAATNPLLLPGNEAEEDRDRFQFPPLEIPADSVLRELIREYGAYETPWKYRWVHDAVAVSAERGEKTLIWSSFVRNLRTLEASLSDFQPALVHGGIPPADMAPRNAKRIREREIERFRSDPSCSVLLANPAATGEGVSLHHECHRAIYLDRTFNAGQFLQSQDRIHRLGLPPDVETQFDLLVSEDSIDEVVDGRLRVKVENLAAMIGDSDLVSIALPDPDDDLADAGPLGVDQPRAEGDMVALLSHLRDVE